MQDDLTLLLTLDVRAVGQEALDQVTAALEALAAQSERAALELAPLGDVLAGLLNSDFLQPLAQALGNLPGVVGDAIAGLGAVVDAAFAGVAATLGSALAGLGSAALAAIGQAADAIAATGPGQLAAAAGDVLAALAQALGSFGPEAAAQGVRIVTGLWQGIESMAGWLANTAPEWLALNFLTPVEAFFGLSGATGSSSVLAGVGAALVQGLMDGMNGLAEALLATAGAIIAPLLPALRAFQSDFSAAGADLMDSVRAGILSKAGEIADQARAVVQGAIDAARVVLGGIEASIGAAQRTLVGLTDGAAVGHNADGTDFWRGGLTWVGENGPELVNLPRGAQVLPLSGQAALPPGGNGGGNAINVYVSGNTIMSEQDADLLASRVGQAIVRQTGLAYSLVR